MAQTERDTMIISSTAFEHEGTIPEQYSCEGEGINPPLSLEGIPHGTQSLAIIAEDPDTSKGTFDHWVVWNIPLTSHITEDSAPGISGANSSGKTGYHPPCPPNGSHRYFFYVFALDTFLDLAVGAEKKRSAGSHERPYTCLGHADGSLRKNKKYHGGMMGAVKHLVLVGSFVVAAASCIAQFSDSVHHNAGFATTGIINQTNDGNSFVLNSSAKFNIKKKNKYFNSSASWIYGRQEKQLTNNDVTAIMDFDIYGKLPHLYYWGLAGYDKSFSLKINNRLQAGLGLGYNLLDKKNASIVISDGVLYEYSDLEDTTSPHDRYQTLRNSLRLKYHFVWRTVIVLDGVQFWQPSLSSGSDYVIKSTNSLSFKLKKWLNLTSSLTYNKVNRTHSKNLLFTIGLSADYYF